MGMSTHTNTGGFSWQVTWFVSPETGGWLLLHYCFQGLLQAWIVGLFLKMSSSKQDRCRERSGWQFVQQLHWKSAKHGDKRERYIKLSFNCTCLKPEGIISQQKLSMAGRWYQLCHWHLKCFNYLLCEPQFLLSVRWKAGAKTGCWHNKCANSQLLAHHSRTWETKFTSLF